MLRKSNINDATCVAMRKGCLRRLTATVELKERSLLVNYRRALKIFLLPGSCKKESVGGFTVYSFKLCVVTFELV